MEARGGPRARSTLAPWRASLTPSTTTPADEAEEAEDAEERQPDPEREARRLVALAQIRQYPDPVLRMQAREVESFDDELVQLVERMAALMEHADGAGLAATQVGVLRRVFVMRAGENGDTRTLVNPELVSRSDEVEVDDEGCLSLQGLLVPVERSVTVTVKAKDPQGADVTLELDGLRGTRLPARDRSPRRRAHDRSHDRRGPPQSDGGAAAAFSARRTVGVPPRIGFAATAPFGADVLERLAARHEIAFCLTRPDRPAGRGLRLDPPPAKVAAEKLGIPVLQPERLDETVELPARHDRHVRIRRDRPREPARDGTCGSTSTRPCCRAGAAPPPSSGRSWPVTPRPA